MTERSSTVVVVACALGSVGHVNTSTLEAQSGRAACAQIAAWKLPDGKITEAVAVPSAETGAVRAAYCAVSGMIGSEIRFRLLLPDDWNGKFMMGGGGGYVGTVQNQAQASVDAGFATVGTDTGHQGFLTDASWALDNLERLHAL